MYPKVLGRSALGHDFYSADFLPDNGRVWRAVSPYGSREILKRLLELNHSCHAEEEAEAKRTKVGHRPELGL